LGKRRGEGEMEGSLAAAAAVAVAAAQIVLRPNVNTKTIFRRQNRLFSRFTLYRMMKTGYCNVKQKRKATKIFSFPTPARYNSVI